VSRPCIFTVSNLNEVYLPLVDIERLNSVPTGVGVSVWKVSTCVHLCWVVLGAVSGANEE